MSLGIIQSESRIIISAPGFGIVLRRFWWTDSVQDVLGLFEPGSFLILTLEGSSSPESESSMIIVSIVFTTFDFSVL